MSLKQIGAYRFQIKEVVMLTKFSKKGCIKNNKGGFSLVELIVVIAIMAVMAAVLAPSLLGYVEKSRAQKDDSAMSEVISAMRLSLADQAIYDEVLEHSVWDNVSCYIDKKDESQFADYKVQLKAANGDKKEQYMFGDEARLLDETVYYAAGNMRGLTITFSPSESGDTYDFANGVLNKFVGRKTGLLSENPELYNRLRSVIGDKLDTTSQTYRNSDYTIFIRVGSTGGSEAVMQDAIQVWGQFNGTNLAEKDHKYELSSGRVVGTAGANDVEQNEFNNEYGSNGFGENAHLNISNTIPLNGSFVTADGTQMEQGSKFPTLQNGDTFTYGDYVYTYNYGSWEVVVIDKTKTSYLDILESINGYNITNMTYTFANCVNLVDSGVPKIPTTVKTMLGTFDNCSSLIDMSNLEIPVSVTSLHYAFHGCNNLQKPPQIIQCKNLTSVGSMFRECNNLLYAPEIPETITSLAYTFQNCTKLEIAPNIPSKITNMERTFQGCTRLKTVSSPIPATVTNMISTFNNCDALTGTIVVNANPVSYDNCFYDGKKEIFITGNSSVLQELANTATQHNVFVK